MLLAAATAARQQCENYHLSENRRFFSSSSPYLFSHSYCHCIQYVTRPQDKESILWQIICDWVLIHAQFLSYWIIRCVFSQSHTHLTRSLFSLSLSVFRSLSKSTATTAATTTTLKTLLRLCISYLFYRYFLLLRFASCYSAYMNVRLKAINFTGSDLKFRRFSFHSNTRAAPVLTWSWFCAIAQCFIAFALSLVCAE